MAMLTALAIPGAACGGAPEVEDEASSEDAISGRDLDNFIAQATEEGDTPGIKFVPTNELAFQMGRPGAINYVVIHDIEGPGRSAVNTFRRPTNESSAHYVVDRNGLALQMVHERDIANHAFHSVLNAFAIGIEHAGHANANEYTREEYEASAKLVAQIAKRHHIPIDRQHIVGHHQVPKVESEVDACAPNATRCGGQGGHQDPGPNWDWSLYMSLIAREARALGYEGAVAAEQQQRDLTWIDPTQTLKLSKRMFGGYWATQCQTDPASQKTYRTILLPNEKPRAETRYLQGSVGDCGEPKQGVYPIVFKGYPITDASRPDLDLSGLTIEQCERGKKRLYRIDGSTVPCAASPTALGSCREAAASLTSESDGC